MIILIKFVCMISAFFSDLVTINVTRSAGFCQMSDCYCELCLMISDHLEIVCIAKYKDERFQKECRKEYLKLREELGL